MAEAACSPNTHSEQPDIEQWLDRAFQTLWDKLEALMFPENTKAVPVIKPRTHLSETKQVQARAPRVPSRPEGRKQRDTHQRQETEDLSGGNRNRQEIVRTHTSPISHQPNGEGLSPMIMAEGLEKWETTQQVPPPAIINFADKHSSLTAEPTLHAHTAARRHRRGNTEDAQQQATNSDVQLPLRAHTNLQRHKCGRLTPTGLQPKGLDSYTARQHHVQQQPQRGIG
ncbi:Hypothetical predicted protein [Pelobates cultripes]|nr:Hypothetical predicted protein [Pelobates cultripes]